MHRFRLVLVAGLVLSTMAFIFPQSGSAQGEEPPDGSTLSPYWKPVVRRWDTVIQPHAEFRQLDPDLVAAVIWKESMGLPDEESIVGAVGLMGLMPFKWRPDPEELAQPDTNLFWGARALAHTIRDGHGDLFYSLAAYNGGWDQIHLRITRWYAGEVLDCYSRAVAVRYGLAEDGDWIAIFAVEGLVGQQTITVIGPQYPLTRYTERPVGGADIPVVPDGPPHTTAIVFEDERGVEGRVNVWLVHPDSSPVGAVASQKVDESPRPNSLAVLPGTRFINTSYVAYLP